MKKNLLYSFLIGACLTTVASCDLNNWNDKLEGFEGDPAITNKQVVEYTLTNADYANLAANSDNIAKAGNELSKELKAVGTQHYFTENISAKDYVPNFLSDPDFAYFTLTDGSSIKLTYNVGASVPEIIAFSGAKEYTVSEDDYIYAWDDDSKYVESFTPKVSAKANIPDILTNQLNDAAEGDMVVVNYKESSVEPNFGGVTPPTPSFDMTSVVGTAAKDSKIEARGLVTGICSRGFIFTDNSGSILVYYASGFNAADYKIGDQVELAGDVSAYGTGLQVTGTSATVNVKGNQDYAYPAPKVYTGAELDQAVTRTADALAIYGQFTATAKVSGNYYNFVVDGAETAQGSLYMGTDEQKALFADGQKYVVTGYFIAISGKKYTNFIVTGAKAVSSISKKIKSATFSVSSNAVSAVYRFDGTKWSEYSSIYAVGADDYAEMGQKYSNLSEPDYYLPIFLKGHKPYAKEGDTQLIAYKYYASGTNTLVCNQFTFDGTNWVKFNGYVTESAQFVKTGGKWMYDPNVNIILPTGKGIEISTTYYQACVDWVYENIDKPLGSTSIKSGLYYVTSYGNNEYYCGTSAYQGNVDIRAAKAKEQYPAGYEGKTDEEIVELMKTRFCKEVLPGALSKLHPDAAPVPGLEVIYSVTFGVYDGANSTETVRYKVVGQGQFEFLDCTWWTK